MIKRKIKKLSKAVVRLMKGTKWLVCKNCKENEVMVSTDTKAVTCAECVQQMVAPPPERKVVTKSDKPRGWHFKAYFESDGVVYSKGKKITDPNKISQLRKKFGGKPSKVKKPVKKVKKQRVKK